MLDNLPRGTICIEDMEMGMTRYLQKVVTDDDIEMFAQVSTDRNPVHLDDDYAQDTIFQGRIAHGMLTAGLISGVRPGFACLGDDSRWQVCLDWWIIPARTFSLKKILPSL